MVRSTLALQTVAEAGSVPTFSAANVDGHMVAVPALLYVKNGGGGSINVTVQTAATDEGRAVADDVIAVANGAEKIIALRSRDLLIRPADPDAGTCYVDFSGVTSVTVALLR